MRATASDDQVHGTALPRTYVVVLSLFLVAALVTELLLVRTFNGLDTATKGYTDGTRVITILADIQRETLKTREAILVHGDPDHDDVQLRRDLLARHVSVMEQSLLDLDFMVAQTPQAVARIRTHLDELDEVLTSTGPVAARADAALALLAELDADVKATSSNEEVAYVDTLRAVELQTERVRVALVLMTALTLLLGIGLAVAVSRRWRRLYGRAYMQLRSEMDVRAEREEQLEEQAEQLVQYAAELEAANEALRIADATKNDFVSTVSHELRTPLTAIRGFAQTLELRWDDLDDDQRFGLVSGIERQGRRQQRLIDDLLTVSRMVAGTLEAYTGPVDVERAIRSAVETTHLTQVVVDVPTDTSILFDADHLAQILTNLLTNADKYGAGTITVEARQTGQVVEVRVVDEGQGIDAEFLPRLFDRFEQASTGDRRTASGLGLGLSISKELAELNHGGLRYETSPHGGACFVLAAPAHVAAPRPARQVTR